MADEFTRHATAFIEGAKDQPFFLYFATHDIHVPHVPNPRFVGKTPMGARGDAIVEFDDCVGKIAAKLEELKLSDNTLIIVTSDNGPVLDDGYQDASNEKLGDHKPAGPWRGGKYSLFEGGTRVPFIVRWSGTVKPGVSDAMISQVDFSATLAALAGGKPDATTMPDSVNVLPALLGKSPVGRDHIIEHSGRLALRQGKWKFIPPGQSSDQLGPWKSGKFEAPGGLFDLEKDPGETTNVAAEHPDQVGAMRTKLSAVQGTP